jgi:hypothetical protein
VRASPAARAAVSLCARPAPTFSREEAERQVRVLLSSSPGISRQEDVTVDELQDDVLNYCIAQRTYPAEIVELELQQEFCAIPCKTPGDKGKFLQACLFNALRTTYPPPEKTFEVTCLDKQGQVLSNAQHVCPKPDSFNRLIIEMYRKGLLDPASGKRCRDWETLQDKGEYTYSEDDVPVVQRVTELENRADNVVKKEEEMMGGAMRKILEPCKEFQNLTSLDALRVLYAPSQATARLSKTILTTVESPDLYETSNELIHALLGGSQPRFTDCEKRFEFDAVLRARIDNADVAILVEHKTTLDTEKLLNFTKKLEKLNEVSQEDGGQSMLSAFRGMHIFPVIYGRAPNDAQLSALQAEAEKANILLLCPGALPAVEFEPGSTRRERKRTCEEYQRFLREPGPSSPSPSPSPSPLSAVPALGFVPSQRPIVDPLQPIIDLLQQIIRWISQFKQ